MPDVGNIGRVPSCGDIALDKMRYGYSKERVSSRGMFDVAR